MKHIDLKLGYSCNNNCIHCVIADQKRHARKVFGREDKFIEEIRAEVLQAKNSGFDSISVTGGEPSIRPDFFDILSLLRFQDFRITVQTNGRLFCDKAIATRLALYRPYVVVALHGATAHIHDRITRVSDSHKETLSGISHLISAGVQVCGKVVISKINCKELRDLVTLFDSLSVQSVCFAFPHAHGNAHINFDVVIPRYQEAVSSFLKAIDEASHRRMSIGFEAVPHCILRDNPESVQDFTFEDESPIILKQFGYETQDWHVTRRRLKRKGPRCTHCIYDAKCEGIWMEYAEHFGFDEFNPVCIHPLLSSKS